MKVIKRDCTEVEFDKSKISNAILKAMRNGSGIIRPKIAESIADEIYNECKNKDEVSISEIESLVYDKLISKKQRLTAKAYEGYYSNNNNLNNLVLQQITEKIIRIFDELNNQNIITI